MSTPTEPPIEPATDQEWELLEAYRDLDEADRVLVWSTMLRELGRRADPEAEERER